MERIAEEGVVNHILQGTLSRAGDLFRIDYTLQEVGSGKIIGTSRVEGQGEASMFAIVDELTRKIKQDLKLSEAEIASDFDKSIGQITTSSPEAYKLYVEAARLHSLGENRRAIPYYEKQGKIAERQGDRSKAMERYTQFLDLWKDADPGIPEVEDARKRLEGLRALNPF